MSKLGTKLLIVILSLTLGGLVIVSVFINISINQNFENYLQAKNKNQVNKLIELLKNNFNKTKQWQDNLEEIEEYTEINRLKILLKNKSGNLVYSNHRGLIMGNIPRGKNIKEFELKNNEGEKIGTLLWLIPPRKNLFSEHEQLFSRQINQVIFYTAGLIAMITVIVSFFLSRYLTNPLLEINNTAQKVAKGEFDKRVQIRGNDELAELGKAFNDMVVKLNQLEETRKESISNFTHELRTPITNINNYLEAIEDGIIASDDKTISEIKEELNRLFNLINRLKDLNEAEEKIINLQKKELNIIKLIKDIVNKYKLPAEKRNINITEKYFKKQSFFRGDKEGLKTIFNNLLSNAIKYTNKDGKIEIIVTLDKDYIIKIKNTGAGIAKGDLPYIFERFYRADKSRNIEGSGIGLTITKKLVEAHNGKIKVDSDDNETVFTIRLPS